MQIHTPVVPTQVIYRQLLQAMSHPGRVYQVPLKEWGSLLLAVSETLLDHEVSYCVLPEEDSTWSHDIFAVTKARQVPLSEADYIIIKGHESHGALEQAKLGVPPFPDQGATVIYVMESVLSEAEALSPMLSGPGLAHSEMPQVNPLTVAEWRLLRDLNAEYPLGVDTICLIGQNQVMCIPRSTQIKMG